MNQIEFFADNRTNRYNARVANATLQNDDRRDVDFEISQNEKNDIDSSFDALQIRVSVKRALQNITATINNQSSKKNALKTRKTNRANRVLIYFRELISMFFHMFFDVLFSLLFFHETLNAFRNELLRE